MDYFAYGSNSPEQLAERLGHEVKVEGLATLIGYRFVYQGRAVKRQCATANVVPSREGSIVVYGVLYSGFTDEDFVILDKAEGVKHTSDGAPDGRYMRVTREVWMEPEEAEPRQAELYVLTGKLKTDQQLFPPSREYVLDVMRSAMAAGYPNDYIVGSILPLTFNDVVTVQQPAEMLGTAT